ncbi:MAG TPA: DUF6221 family protein [Streptosporangiaceae bacterium]|nr:DUF6221 family protein [Streptosporangiaceae bacterium]
MSDGLVAFWRARLDEAEAAARESLDAPDGALRYLDVDQWGDSLVHLFDEDRVLREVEADRAILALHRQDPEGGFTWGSGATTAGNCAECSCEGALAATECFATVDYPCKTVRIRVSVYSDHPDYQQEWKP